MPPAAKRDYAVILYDVNTSNKYEALMALIKIYTYKWLSNSKDIYKFILSNTRDSRNSEGFKNIYETKINALDPQPILECVESAEGEEGNWLDAISLAIHHLKEAATLPGIITLQILYITKLDGCKQHFDQSRVKKIVEDLTEYEIFLYIIGPDIKLPYTITSEDDVPSAMKEILLDETVSSLAVAKKIITSIETGVLCDLKVGIHLFFTYKNPHGSQPWKVPLSFGSNLQIPASTVKILKRDVPFKLQAEASDFHYVLTEDESVPVDPSEIISGILKHGKFVKLDEREMFKIEGPRNFGVLGFTESKYVPEYYMRGDGCFHVLPDPGDSEDAFQAFSALVKVLAQQDKYAIVRRVYNANNKPKFFTLVPQPDLQPKCFVMTELPYADDLDDSNHFVFKDPKTLVTKEKTEEDDVCTMFFKSIDLWDKKCQEIVPLGPKVMLDPHISQLANAAAKKYLMRDFDFDLLEIDDVSQVSNSNKYLDALNDAWPASSTKEKDEDDTDDDIF